MRAVIQRVKCASLSVGGEVFSEIGYGMAVLVGITPDDAQSDIDYIADKCAGLRIFDDEDGVMNLSAEQTNAQLMVVSQFTLLGDARKGKRPSYINAAKGETAKPLYERLVSCLEQKGLTVKTGVFGADMQVSLINDGPVTILLDSKKTF